MATFTLSKEYKEKIKKEAQDRAKSLATEARDLMAKEYISIIQQFYTEYEPEYYYRHKINYSDSGIMDTGLGRTFEKYYKESHSRYYSGGIWIDTVRHDGTNRNMFTDYSGTPEQVMNTFMLGFHGPVSHGSSESNPQYYINGTSYWGINLGLNHGYMDVYEHMVRYRYSLIQEFAKRLKISL